MKYISLDIETTGLDPTKDQILSVAMIYDDLEKPYDPGSPSLHFYVNYERISGSPYAISMNNDIVSVIAKHGYKDSYKGVKIIEEDQILNSMQEFASYVGLDQIILAGKNLGSFDIQFLNALKSKYNTDTFKHSHRFIDPAMFYMDIKDVFPPSLSTCTKRAGLNYNKDEAHDALYDAQLVVGLIRHHYDNRSKSENNNDGVCLSLSTDGRLYIPENILSYLGPRDERKIVFYDANNGHIEMCNLMNSIYLDDIKSPSRLLRNRIPKEVIKRKFANINKFTVKKHNSHYGPLLSISPL